MNEKEKVLALAEKHDVSIDPDHIIIDQSGVDFLVAFVVDTEKVDWVFRMPRRDDVIERTKVEKQVLDIVNRYVTTFNAPDWLIYSEDLIAYPKLSGVPVGTIDIEKQAYEWTIDPTNLPDNFHQTFAEALAELHQLESKDFEDTDIEIVTADELRPHFKKRMQAVKDEFGVSEALWQRWMNWLDDESLWPKQTVLIHGDAHAGHILIDQDANVTALIDWTEAKISDPAMDFSVYYTLFGEDSLDRLIEAYRAVGGYTWLKMKQHIIETEAAFPIAIAEFAKISDLEEYKQMAREALGVS
ncbi:macrolide phosphotransferase [Pelagirhabdus alkalitolerans]|uniref:Macrolide phosphotransferase n=1 Tax=Pelagirhabdus alkalitolerans TaxID=1612202 RepID=A0A1G6IK89_9BACI|nr:macrolide 2'-phosphotransferase [Pelagirhabdus alkalitolerans]SDC06949.1 macrolide phosphotransferase [Pelagirhabdus alkalitolerans]